MTDTARIASDLKNITLDKDTFTIHFNTCVDAQSITVLNNHLMELQRLILKKQKKLKRKFDEFMEEEKKSDEFDEFEIEIKPKYITLNISSYGGSVHQALIVIDTILNSKVPVHTICTGGSASAGTMISIHGHKRSITRNAYMLIHEVSGTHSGRFSELQLSLEHSEMLMRQIKDMYISRTNLTEEQLDEQLRKDEWWNAERCLETGLVDEII